MADSKILNRIERKLGISGIVSLLVERLEPTDLQSILLEVYRQRVRRQHPADVLSVYDTNRFVQPSTLSPIRLLEWEQTAFANLPDEFQSLTLSPVCPLGTSATVALVDQNRVLSTIRNTEIVSDSTNVLALECALRRRQFLHTEPRSKKTVHLATSHRLLRTQQYNNAKAITHFSAFTLCSAGQDQGNLQFELSVLILHIRFYIRALTAFLGSDIPLRLTVTDFGLKDRKVWLMAQLLSPIQEEFMNVECVMDDARTSGRNYYVDLCFHIYATNATSQLIELVDGGVVDWTQQFLNNAKERCVISGIGSERVCTEFVGRHS